MKLQQQMLMIDAVKLAEILREAMGACRNEGERDGVSSVTMRIMLTMPAQDQAWFQREAKP